MKWRLFLVVTFLVICVYICHSQTIITSVDSDSALALNNSRKVALAPNGTVSLVFHDKGDIYYTESENGISWSMPINVSQNAGISQFPALAIHADGRKHVVWQDQSDDKIRIYYKNFVDLSEIPQKSAISIGESVGNTLHPSLTVDKEDGTLYASWAANMGLNKGWEINYSQGTLIGSGLLSLYDWTYPAIPGEPLGIGASFFPSIDIYKAVIFIVWLEFGPTEQKSILIKFRNAEGWSESFNLSYEAIGPYSFSIAGIPNIVVDCDTIAHIVFQEILEVQNNTFNDVFYLDHKMGDTLTFEDGENVSQLDEASTNPVITLDVNKTLYVAWEQELMNRAEIFLNTKQSGEWSEPQNISLSEENSVFPQITLLDDDSLLAVWVEGETSPYKIIAKKLKPVVTSVKDEIHDNSNIIEFQLFQNYPNPFNNSTFIPFYLPHPIEIEINVLNSIGQIIKILYKGKGNYGYQNILWDGTDNQGVAVSSGIYMISLNSGSQYKTIKAMLIK